LDYVGGHSHRDVGCVHPAVAPEAGEIGVVALGLGCGDLDDLAGRFEGHRHVHQHQLQALEVGEARAEPGALLGITEGVVERALCNADTLRADRDASVIQGARSAILSPSARFPITRSPGMHTLSKYKSWVGEPLISDA
jgi:hypothetical protein